jgi:hypothetical protein
MMFRVDCAAALRRETGERPGDSIGLLNEYPPVQNVRDRMLSVGIRRDHADAIRERERTW